MYIILEYLNYFKRNMSIIFLGVLNERMLVQQKNMIMLIRFNKLLPEVGAKGQLRNLK
jgi:hypothetical protein